MTDRESMIGSICEQPHDTTLRLIFADWLEERGECERAEFIRCQVELASLGHKPYPDPADFDRWGSLHCREQELLEVEDLPNPFGNDSGIVWTQYHNPTSAGCVAVKFSRGFVESVACRLSDWIGEECLDCADAKGRARQYAYDGNDRAAATALAVSTFCDRCHGIGRLNAHGPEIVLAQPVTTVRVTDREPASFSDIPAVWNRSMIDFSGFPEPATYPASYLPGWLFDLMDGERGSLYFVVNKVGDKRYNSISAAHAALSTTLIRWARQRAGLPELVYPRGKPMKSKTPPKVVYRCEGCHKRLAQAGKRQPFVGVTPGCVFVLHPHEAPQLKCICGHTTIVLKASI